MASIGWDKSLLKQALKRARLRQEAKKTKGSYKGTPWTNMASAVKHGVYMGKQDPRKISKPLPARSPDYRPTHSIRKAKPLKPWGKT